VELICSPVVAQTLTVRLLNAKTGKVIRKENVTINWDIDLKSSRMMVGEDGSARFKVPAEAKHFAITAGPKTGSEPNRIAYKNCNDQTKGFFAVSDALENGIVPRNVCGSKSATSHAGEIIFWALPNSFWDFQ
jgi:hypothetical protein